MSKYSHRSCCPNSSWGQIFLGIIALCFLTHSEYVLLYALKACTTHLFTLLTYLETFFLDFFVFSANLHSRCYLKSVYFFKIITSFPYYSSKSAACPSLLPLTTDVNDCNGSCLNGGSCIDGLKSFTCNCLAGYTGRLCETGRIESSLGTS